MKKIVGLALALAAAALVFVGCSDEVGGGDTKGSKWDTTMTIDATKASGKPAENNAENRRFWKQLGDNTGKNSVAGITTTITVRDENYTSNAGNSGVVGLMFDYNDSKKGAYGSGSADKTERKDFCLIGFNFDRRIDDSTKKPQVYVLREEGVPYNKQDIYDTNDGDLVTATNGAVGANLTGTTTTLNNSNVPGTGFLKTNSWIDMAKGTDFVHENGEYKIVVQIRPILDNAGYPSATDKGYEVLIGKSEGSLRSICKYNVDFTGSKRDEDSVTEITIGQQEYSVACGGIAVYGNAKTEFYNNDGEGTKIIANYKTDRAKTDNGNKVNFSKDEFDDFSVIGDLKIANTSDGNITVIVE